jgi:hypothetical protein
VVSDGTGMNLESTPQERYPLLTDARNRHLAWACEFSIAGDIDSAIDALRDAHATSAELRGSDTTAG